MNPLTPQELDAARFQDPRKPLRQFIDDKILPNVGMVMAPPVAAFNAIRNLKRSANIIPIPK
jgi:hypothetical protein